MWFRGCINIHLLCCYIINPLMCFCLERFNTFRSCYRRRWRDRMRQWRGVEKEEVQMEVEGQNEAMQGVEKEAVQMEVVG